MRQEPGAMKRNQNMTKISPNTIQQHRTATIFLHILPKIDQNATRFQKILIRSIILHSMTGDLCMDNVVLSV